MLIFYIHQFFNFEFHDLKIILISDRVRILSDSNLIVY